MGGRGAGARMASPAWALLISIGLMASSCQCARFADVATYSGTRASSHRRLQQAASTVGGVWAVGEWTVETLLPSATAASGISMIAAGADGGLSLRPDGVVEGYGPLFPASAAVFQPAGRVIAMEVGSAGMSTATSSLFLLANGTAQDWTTQCTLVNDIFCSRLNTVPDAARSDVVGIAVGSQFSYAVKRSGAVVEWHFMLTDSTSGLDAGTLANVAKLVVGADSDGAEHGVVLFTNRTVATRGVNYGTVPADVASSGGVTDIAAGGRHSLALITPGRVAAWGENEAGQVNVPAAAQANVIKIAAGGAHSLALLANGTIVCWGGTTADKQCAIPAAARRSKVKDIKASGSNSVALLEDGTVVAWGVTAAGYNVPATLPTKTTSSGIAVVAAGRSHDVVLDQSGKMLGFGDNAYNQLSLPEALQSRRFTHASTGPHQTLLVLDIGQVACLGTRCNIPAQMPPAGRVAAGDGVSCALGLGGSVTCWDHLTSDGATPTGTVAGWDMGAVSTGVRHIAIDPSSDKAFAGYDNGTVVNFSTRPAQVMYSPAPGVASAAAVTKLAAAPWYVLILLQNGTAAYGTTQSIFASDALPVPPGIQGQVRSLAGKLDTSMYILQNGSTIVVPTSGRSCKPPPVAALDVSLVSDTGIDCRYLSLVDSTALANYRANKATPASPVNRGAPAPPTPSPANVSMPVLPPVGLPVRGVTVDTIAVAADATNSKKTPLGAIIGGVVGGVLLLAALIAGLLLYRRRKRATPPPPPPYKGRDGLMGSGPGSSYTAPSDVYTVTNATSQPYTGTGSTWGTPVWGSAVVAANPRSGIVGISPGELFSRTTALDYSWATLTAPREQLQVIEAGVNDAHLDGMLKGKPGATTVDCPVVRLTKEQLREGVHLLPDGLLGKGATAVAFSCVWPARFGPDALLAVKVLKDGHEAHVAELESFAYETNILALTRHPNVVRMYGFCLEPPNVCIIMELLQSSMKDVLVQSRSLTQSDKPASGFDWSSNAIGRGASSSGGVARGDSSTGASSSGASADGAARRHSAVGDVPDGTVTVSTTTPNTAPAQNPKSLPEPTPGAPTTAPLAPVPLSMETVLAFSIDIAAGLAYLHDIPLEGGQHQPGMQRTASADSQESGVKQNRIVHRDMKPANILLNSRGVLKISDFGLARAHENTTIVTEHVGAGTLSYMAPELLIGSYGGYKQNITNKVDIYSMSIIMYELLTSDHPWKGLNELALVAAVTGGKRPHLPADRAGPDDTQLDVHVPAVRPGIPLSQVPVSLYAWPEFNTIIRMCWQHRESKRPTAHELHRMLVELWRKHHA